MLAEEEWALFKQMRVGVMGQRAREICNDPEWAGAPLEDVLREMPMAQVASKEDNKRRRLMSSAKFKIPGACLEEMICLPERKLDKSYISGLADCRWVEGREVIVIIATSGCGKSYLAQALGVAACRELHSVAYSRLQGVCGELNMGRIADDGSYYDSIDRFKRAEVLIVDDFLATPISTANSIDLFETMEAREGTGAAMIATHLEPEQWYLRIEGELMADSILNRLATGARYIDIEGPNMREYLANLRKASGGAS